MQGRPHAVTPVSHASFGCVMRPHVATDPGALTSVPRFQSKGLYLRAQRVTCMSGMFVCDVNTSERALVGRP